MKILTSATVKAAKKAAAPANRPASCQEYQAKVEPPLRNPSIRSVIQAVRVPTPIQSTWGLVEESLDSFRARAISATETTPRGRFT
jgi:hypothetical protein